jgi:hypothetical protein
MNIAQYNPHTYTGWVDWAWYQFQIVTESDSTVYHPKLNMVRRDFSKSSILIYKGQ